MIAVLIFLMVCVVVGLLVGPALYETIEWWRDQTYSEPDDDAVKMWDEAGKIRGELRSQIQQLNDELRRKK